MNKEPCQFHVAVDELFHYRHGNRSHLGRLDGHGAGHIGLVGKPCPIAEVLDGAVKAQNLLLAANAVLEPFHLALDEHPQELWLILFGIDDLALAVGVDNEVLSDEMLLVAVQDRPNLGKIFPDDVLYGALDIPSLVV